MLYSIDSGSVTIAAAHTTKGAVGTIKFVNGFWNPTTSGVNAIIQNVTGSMVSGTPVGPLFLELLSADYAYKHGHRHDYSIAAYWNGRAERDGS